MRSKNQKKRPDFDIDGMEKVLRLGVNDYRSLWTPICYAANSSHWTQAGWAKLGDEHYFNLQCASLFPIGRWAKHLSALLPAKRSIDTLVLQRNMRESSDVTTPAHWPNLPIRSAMPNTPKGWQAMAESYGVCLENKGYQHMLNSWGPIGKKLLASITDPGSQEPSTGDAEPVQEESTSPLSECGHESDKDTLEELAKTLDKPIVIDEHNSKDSNEDKNNESNSDFSEPDDTQGSNSRPQTRTKQSSKLLDGPKPHDHISISDSNDNIDTTDDEPGSLGKSNEDYVESQMVKLLGQCVANPNLNTTPPKLNSSKVPTEPAVPLSSMMYLGPSVAIEHLDMPDQLSLIEDCEAIQQSMDKRTAVISAILLSGRTDDVNYRTVESDCIAHVGVLGLSAYSIWRACQCQAQLDSALNELSDLQRWTEHLIGLQETQRKGILETQVYLTKMKAELRQGGRLLSEARSATIEEATAQSSQIPDFPTKASVLSGVYHIANNHFGPPGPPGPPGHGTSFPSHPGYPHSNLQHPPAIGYHHPHSAYSNGNQQFYQNYTGYNVAFPDLRHHNMVPLSSKSSYSNHHVSCARPNGPDRQNTVNGGSVNNSMPSSTTHDGMYNLQYGPGYQVCGPGYLGNFQNGGYNNGYQNNNYSASEYDSRMYTGNWSRGTCAGFGSGTENTNRRKCEPEYPAGESEEPSTKFQRSHQPSSPGSPRSSNATSGGLVSSVSTTEEKERGIRGTSAPASSMTEAELRVQINGNRILKTAITAGE